MAASLATFGYSKLLAQPFQQIFPSAQLPWNDARIPVETAHALLAQAVAQTGDVSIGLKAGRMISYGDGGALDYAMQSAATVEQALLTASRFIRLLNGQLALHTETRGTQALVRLETRMGSCAAAEDFMMSALYTVHMQRLVRGTPLQCWFTQPRPRDTSEHDKTFANAQVRFSSPHSGFVFSAAALSAQLPSADPKLHRILVAHLTSELAELPEAHTLTERVWLMLSRQTPLTSSKQPVVARSLKMSTRTFARRLEAEGASFGELLDRARRTRALSYLTHGTLGVEEIAFNLGFSRGSAFHRAFKRWTGQTPRAYSRAARS